MMSRVAMTIAGVLLTCGPLLAEASAAKFAKPPVATKTPSGVKIDFAVDAATDCDVRIINAAGKTVRQLAGGVLGKNAPEPLAKDALAQSLVWDGNDDLGKSAGNGPFKVQVRLGLKPAFDGVIGSNPAALGPVQMVATGPGGEVFVMHSQPGFGSGASHVLVVVFDRNGKYLRTILPPPANLPEDRLKGLKRIEVDKGVMAPFVYNGETRATVPGLGGERWMFRGVVSRDGRLALVGNQEILRDRGGLTQVVVIRTDGSVPEPVKRTVISRDCGRSTASMALSPDEKTIYATGLRYSLDGLKADNAVYAFGWDDPSARLLAGDQKDAGKGEKRFNEPTGVATDKDGNVYVADRGNDRVVKLRPDGTYVGELAVAAPTRVEVHARTGAIYVLSSKAFVRGGSNAKFDKLMRFDSFGTPEPAIAIDVPKFGHVNYMAVMTLDSEAETPVLWIGSYHSTWMPFTLMRFEDKGKSFAGPTDVAAVPGNQGPSAHKATDLALLPDKGLALWPPRDEPRKPKMFNPRTGELMSIQFPKLSTCGNIWAAGKDGNLYVYYGYPDAMLGRYSADLKAVPFTGQANGVVEKLGSPRTRGRGLFADARGNVYVLVQKGDPTAAPDAEGRYGDANAINVYGPDGKLIKEKLIDSDIRSLNSVCADNAGNIYVAVGARPAGQLVPPYLKGQVPDSEKDPQADCGHNYYPLMYGTIVKFGPQGGVIRTGGEAQGSPGGVPMEFGYTSKVSVRNSQWTFFGASTVPSWRTRKTPNICLCESSRMDVDGSGRVFFPDACGCRVGVLDSAGNLVCWFGRYGNADSAGPGSKVPTPDIPLGWPAAVSVDDSTAFIGDRLNSRVVRVKLDYAASAACPIN